MLTAFLTESDAARATEVLRKLRRQAVQEWALTGGLAVEIHRVRSGLTGYLRTLNDLDFVVPRFECIPDSLSSEFLCRHIYPLDPPNKTIAQFVDPDQRLSVDVFRASEGLFGRTIAVHPQYGSIRVVSLEDLTARLTRIVLQIAKGIPVASKHADDLVRLLETVDPARVQAVWLEHRLPDQPMNFRDACDLLLVSMPSCPHLLVTVEYSKDTSEVCKRCVPTRSFCLASTETVLSILGYC